MSTYYWLTLIALAFCLGWDLHDRWTAAKRVIDAAPWPEHEDDDTEALARSVGLTDMTDVRLLPVQRTPIHDDLAVEYLRRDLDEWGQQ